MSAPITKQHLKIIDEIRVGDRSMRFDITDAQAAQLIADSEARACDQLRAEVEQLKEYSANLENDVKYLTQGVPEGDPLFLAIARAERAEAELADIRALANRRNKRDHSQDTTHQLVAALDQALDIAQAELAATKSTLDEEVNCAEKAEHEAVRQYARAERAEADADSTRERALALANSLDEAQAELATERARLDYVIRVCYATNREAIDAAMKEGGK